VRVGVKLGPVYASTSTRRRRSRRSGRGGGSGTAFGWIVALIAIFWPLALGQKQGGGYHPWVWAIAIPWWVLVAFIGIGYLASKSDKSKSGQRESKTTKTRPSTGKPVPGGANIDYKTAYSDTMESMISTLWRVTTPDSARTFTSQAAQHIRSNAQNVPEFYVGEFLSLFKNAVVSRARAEIAACKRAVADTEAEADSASVELQARLTTAIAANDREAEHAVWREREARQAACQAKVDASSRHIASVNLRLDTCKDLASALGVSFT
jgi:hypothetical protein